MADLISDIFGGVKDAISGTVPIDAIINLVNKHWPAPLTETEKADMDARKATFELEARKAGWEHEKQINDAIGENEKAINDRISIYEGTAADLKALPVVGPIMIFLRGSMRVVVGYVCLYLDYEVFSSTWILKDAIIENAFWIINILVYGFLFGERAVQNVMPLVTQMIAAKKGP